jgi:hypothetical protein
MRALLRDIIVFYYVQLKDIITIQFLSETILIFFKIKLEFCFFVFGYAFWSYPEQVIDRQTIKMNLSIKSSLR